MRTFIYESPKGERHRSGPVLETETARRALLEERGWRVVETHDDTAPVREAVTEVVTVASDERFDFLTAEQRAALQKAGFTTEDALRNATDADLRNVQGIGPAAVRDIRKALTGP